MKKEIKTNNEGKIIITEDGLFYSNFDRFRFPLFLLPGSDCYSENLVQLRDTYGLAVGEQQPDSAGQTHENTIGVYIKDYKKYLSDLDALYKKPNMDDEEIIEDIKQKEEGVARLR